MPEIKFNLIWLGIIFFNGSDSSRLKYPKYEVGNIFAIY